MFILASSSPRRKELLRKIVPSFEIVVPEVDESSLSFLSPKDLPAEESKLKAYAVASRFPDDEVLACDTVVLLDGVALGKPKDAMEARAMLRKESGRKQIVLSAYTYIGRGKEITRTVKTEVFFHELDESLIETYVATGSPLDKAGAYGIQDPFPLVKEIRGSYDNVMGLPTEDIKKALSFLE